MIQSLPAPIPSKSSLRTSKLPLRFPTAADHTLRFPVCARAVVAPQESVPRVLSASVEVQGEPGKIVSKASKESTPSAPPTRVTELAAALAGNRAPTNAITVKPSAQSGANVPRTALYFDRASNSKPRTRNPRREEMKRQHLRHRAVSAGTICMRKMHQIRMARKRGFER